MANITFRYINLPPKLSCHFRYISYLFNPTSVNEVNTLSIHASTTPIKITEIHSHLKLSCLLRKYIGYSSINITADVWTCTAIRHDNKLINNFFLCINANTNKPIVIDNACLIVLNDDK